MDPAARPAQPLVKICGVTDEAGVLAAIRAGADAIGLNFAPGTPRVLSIEEGVALARLAAGPPPRRAAVRHGRPAAADRRRDGGPAGRGPRAVVAAVDPDVVQLNGDEPPSAIAAVGRPVWKALRVGPRTGPRMWSPAPGRSWTPARRGSCSTPPAARTRAAPGSASTWRSPRPSPARSRSPSRAASDRPTSPRRSLAVPATGVDVASGTDAPRVAGERPRKDPLAVALFVKRARDARRHRPNVPFGPTPVHAGLLEVDAVGRWGMERDFGGRYVPETLVGALERARVRLRRHPPRPAVLGGARRPPGAVRGSADRALPGGPAGRRGGRGGAAPARAGRGAPRRPVAPSRAFRLYLKREDLAHTGAHKINNALGQALLTRRLGKTRVIAETGAGQHGVATATACALLGLPCVVFMGEEDIRRQAPNVLRMRALGAEVRSVTSGTATLKDAVNEAMRDWVTNVETTHYVLGSAMGPHPYPTIVRDLQRRIGDEAAAQLRAVEGRLPDLALACVGGGSNAIGLLARFIGEPSVRLAVAEAAGDGIETGRHAAAIAGGTPGHPPRLAVADAPGSRRPGGRGAERVGRSRLPGRRAAARGARRGGRMEVGTATDREAIAAMRTVTRTEGILPALETSHAVAALPKLLAGLEGSGVPYPDDARGPARVLGPRRQGHGGARALRRRRAVGGRAVSAGRGGPRPHQRHDRGAADRRGLRPGPCGRAGGPDPVRRRRLPGRGDLLRRRVRGDRRRGRPARGRAAVLGPARRRGHAPAGLAGRRSAAGATFDRSLALVGADRRGPPVRCRWWRWATRTSSSAAATGGTGPVALATAGVAGVIVADLTPDEGAPFEAVAAEAGIAVVYLVAPTSSPARRAAVAARSGGFLYCVSLVGVTGARTSLPPTVARLVRDVTAVSPVPGRRRLRRLEAGARPGHRRGAGADGVIVASALVDALGADGRDAPALAALVAKLRAATRPRSRAADVRRAALGSARRPRRRSQAVGSR